MEENVTKIPGKKNNFTKKNDTMKSGEKTNKTMEKKTISLTTLIFWNVKKAFEMNPAMDIKSAIKEAQRRLEIEARDISVIISEFPEERHLACALLAWQQLGHRDADSLCRFVEEEKKSRDSESVRELSVNQDKSSIESRKDTKYFSLESFSGPVVKLPLEPKIVMRLDNTCCQGPRSGNKSTERDILNKIEAACCKMDSGCVDRLTGMDDTLKDLRNRAAMLGRREAERVQLLERAEAAWRDLERGYKRRLTLSEEKEEELTKQLQKLIDERNNHKNSCLALTQQLKIKGEVAERDRIRLTETEKDLCERACTRQKLLEESRRLDALLTEHQCKAAQLERDLLFKEEQSRRKMLNIESELDSARALTHEAERAMRAELSSLRDQVIDLSKQLTEEDAENGRINEMLESMREEKMEMIEDLERCKELCDGRMQGITDDLVTKQVQLAELKEKVLECRCKLPRDANVEAKRTPSLVALCHCTPEQKILDACSCTSVRGRILTNLLSDLFSGLQSELGPSGAEMPCQLLKCLEDKHNWDRASIVKTNLKNFFAHLLVGELDIAIANSIERYHAKWVGENCADVISKMTPDPDISRNEEGWQQRVVERRAQKLATQLAQQLFQDKAEELTKQAKDLIASGPPPCECFKEEPTTVSTQVASKSKLSQSPNESSKKGCNSCYTCLVTTGPRLDSRSKSPPPWKQAIQDVTQLRLQIEDLKKDSINKDDLKRMELKIAKIVQRAKHYENSNQKDIDANVDDVMRNLNTNFFIKATQNKSISLKKKHIDGYSCIKKGNKVNSRNSTQQSEFDKTFKSYKKFGQTYAINTCLCSQKDINKINQVNKTQYLQNDGMRTNSKFKNPNALCLVSSMKMSKPISASLLSEDLMSASINSNKKMSEENVCRTNCACFHKVPSNTSIDKLLETLTKWKNDLNDTEEKVLIGKCCPCPANKKQIRGSALNELKCLNNKQSSTNKHESLHDDLNKNNLPQESSQPILKESKSPERANQSMEDRKHQNLQISKKVNSKNILLSKLSTKGGTDSIAKIDNIKAHRSFNKVITSATPENKYNTRSSTDRKVSHNSNNFILNATTLDKKSYINDETQFVIPTTESEYLGAVNLDKSNEEVCKCTISKENENLNKSIHTSLISQLKCVISSKCNCDKVLISKSFESEVFNEKDGKCLIEFNETKYEPANTEFLENNPDTESPCDCNYNIKFLGVTLTDVNPKEQQHHNQFNRLKPLNNFKQNIKNNVEIPTINKLYSEVKQNTKNDEFIKSDKKSDSKLQTVNSAYGITTTVLCSNELDSLKNGENFNTITNNITSGETIKQSKVRQSGKKNQEITNTGLSSRSCECNTKFDKFKNCIDIALQYESSNNDKSHDIQSFIDTEDDTMESCICCDHNDGEGEESKDLEKNAFQLLEEHLKQKLEEFKENSCQSSCIPPHEEEKLFSAILKRVKKIITESTNNISCKCFVKDGEGHGSWSRAYALLQEYLRIKIKRVQCSCYLSEDNKDTILPDVLNKVCNLIDSDFQRLKDVCECQTGKETQKPEVHEGIVKQEHFKYETPEKDTNTDLCIIIDKPCLILEGKQIIKENVLSQVSNFLGMDTKSCDPIRFSNTDNSQNRQSLTRRPTCNVSQKHADSEILDTKKNVTYNFRCLSEDEHKFKAMSDTNTKFTSELIHSKAINDVNRKGTTDLHPPQIRCSIGCACGLGVNFRDSCNKCLADNHDNLIVKNIENVTTVDNPTEKLKNTQSIIEDIIEPKNLEICEQSPRQSFRLCNTSCKNTTEKQSTIMTEDTESYPNAPYVGYTIDCSCDPDLGKCVCTKSIFKPNKEVNNIWKKSLVQNNDEKLSYIMNSINKKPNEEYCKSEELASVNHLMMDNYYVPIGLRHDCETNMSNIEEDEVILRDSKSNFLTANMMTNTHDDNNSVVTESSINEGSLDWCDCCTTVKYDIQNQLKKSIYFPVPMESSDQATKYEDRLRNSDSKESKHCNCDMVPICHVKLLVENIESNLANSKCTCDSMLSKVCPIHSHQ